MGSSVELIGGVDSQLHPRKRLDKLSYISKVEAVAAAGK